MWITKKGYVQEYATDPHTGLKKIVSVKISGTSKKAEQEAFKRLERKIQEIGDVNIRLSDVIKLYLKENEKTWKPSTYSQIVNRLGSVLDIVGDAYMNTLSAGYVRRKFAESGKSPQTINAYQLRLKTLWRWAYQNDYVKTMETADKLSPMRTEPRKLRIQDKYLETNEVKRLLKSMIYDKRYALMTEFLILSGLRVGEAIALNDTDVWGDIIRVNKTFDKANNVTTSTKTLKSSREIHVQPELKTCIEKIREYTKWQKEVFGYESDLFFPDPSGHHFGYSYYAKYVGKMTEKVLGRRLTPHAFRHTHCSMLASKGMSLEAISERLGHEDSKITKEIYFHRMKELKEKENKQLDEIRLLS